MSHGELCMPSLLFIYSSYITENLINYRKIN